MTQKQRKSKGYLLPVVLLIGSAILFALSLHNLRSLRPAYAGRDGTVLVIDPGHGGLDGGAIALNGAKESDINLAIAWKLQKIAAFMGQTTAMTREDDRDRTDIQSYSEHEDLVRRTDFINGVPGGILISIHQNCYPSSQPSGAQVLYAKGEGSRLFRDSGRPVRRRRDTARESDRSRHDAARDLLSVARRLCPDLLRRRQSRLGKKA